MYPNQAFSSGSYSDMFSGSPLLPHNYNGSVGGPNMGDPASNSFAAGDHSHVVPRTQMGIVDTEQNTQCQGLSLSLGTLMPPTASVPPFQYQYHGTGLSSLMNEANLHKELRSAECMASVSPRGFHDSAQREGLYNPNPSVCLKDMHSDPCLQGSQGFSNTLLNSQYIKAAQELLDEIANVRKALKQSGTESKEKFRDIGLDGSKDSDGKSTSQSMQVSSGPNGSNVNPPPELSPGERQNLLEKKTKLLAMLDEVDKRYRQYCHQMQIVVSSFDMVAGSGAAEPYTALALRTISRHFRCLRDAVSGQIQACQRSLGEQEGIPRLRYVDQQLRQQKALQHLGVMRQAWRPQRGLPESSVSILRAWLFEHFLHPYPKDSEKIMLARQTGLTRNQVANWFINARVRLWKPMVEEMYKEEFGDSEMSCNLPITENMLKGKRDDAEASDNKGEESQDNLITVDSSSVQQVGQLHELLKPEHASSSTVELDRGIQGENWMDSGARKMQSNQRFTMNNNDNNNNSSLYSCAPIPINQNGDGSSSIIDSTNTPAATYDLSELGNFTVGGHVSLALELRNCESDGFAISDDAIHKRRNNNQALASSSPEADLLDYHFTDSGKQQHRFSNPHLLHEFVV